MVPVEEKHSRGDRLEKLLEQARDNPGNVPFRRLLRLLRIMGYEFDRQRGSHMIFKRQGGGPRLNLQCQGTVAKPYQVRQVLRAAETLFEDEP